MMPYVMSGLCLALAPAHAGTQALTYVEQTLILDGERRTVRVPEGYQLELLGRMDAPRMLTFSANGDLFAGSKSGKVYRLPPPYTGQSCWCSWAIIRTAWRSGRARF